MYTTTLKTLRTYPTWSDAGQTDDHPDFTDGAEVEVLLTGEVEFVDGGPIAVDVNHEWVAWLCREFGAHFCKVCDAYGVVTLLDDEQDPGPVCDDCAAERSE